MKKDFPQLLAITVLVAVDVAVSEARELCDHLVVAFLLGDVHGSQSGLVLHVDPALRLHQLLYDAHVMVLYGDVKGRVPVLNKNIKGYDKATCFI